MKPMRVGVDATSWVNRRGYGRFARNAVRRLVELDPETHYVLYIDNWSAGEAELPPGAEERRVALRRPPSSVAAAGSHRSVADLLRLTRAVWQDRLDRFLFPSTYTYFPVVGVPTILGLHDTTANDFPQFTLSDRRARALFRIKETLAIRQADRLFTVSLASRAALGRRLGVAPERIALVPEAPDPVFVPRGRAEIESNLGTLDVRPDEPFLLYAGGISPHKNVETLLDAYAMLRRARVEAPRLIVAGDLDSDPYLSAASSVRTRIANLGLEPHVLLPGFLSDDALACLYSAATAVVLPSIAEGFGLPAVEAAACGAPVVLSDLAAHRETLGDAALYFPATDPAELASQLDRVLDGSELRSSLSRRGKEAVRRLSWDLAALKLRDLIHESPRTRAGGNHA